MIRFFKFTDGFNGGKDSVREVLPLLIDGITENYQDTSDDTLLIGSKEEILQLYGSDQRIISNDFIESSMNSIFFDISKVYQVASTCLSGCNIMFIGFTLEERIHMYKIIKILSGDVSLSYNNDVNVIISSSALINNLQDMDTMNIRIVSRSWLDECYETLSCADIRPHILPPFVGFVVTSTNLSPDENREVREIIVNGGGVWSDRFDDDVTTVITSYLSLTPKIRYALRCGVPVVRLKWVYECKGRVCPYHNYVLNSWDTTGNRSSLFQTISFTICDGVKDADIIQKAIVANGGTLSDNGDFKVVDFDYSDDDEFNTITANWIWDCISDSYVHNRDDVLHRPLRFSVPMPEFHGKIFSVVGFNGCERRFFSEAIRVLGGNVIYKISKSSEYVLSADNASGTPYEKNNKRYITPRFVYEVLSNGIVPNMRVQEHNSQGKIDIVLQNIQRMHHRKGLASFLVSENVEGINDFSQRDSFGVVIDVEERRDSDYSQRRW